MDIHYLVIGALLVALALVGCAATPPGVSDVTSAVTLPAALELAAGTLQLEESSSAVDANQAAELAFLWRAYGSLMADDATAATELSAVLDQIEATMTAEQLQAVEEMALDGVAVRSLAADLGLQTEPSTSSTATRSNAQGTTDTMGPGGGTGGAAPGGEAPAGGAPDGDVIGLGGEPAGNVAATASGGNAAQGQNQLLASMVQALVSVLQAKV